jgi:hypothetical protein
LSYATRSIYLLLGLAGFAAPALVADWLNAHNTPGATGNLTPDNVVHILAGIVFLAGGLARYTRTTPLATDATLPHGQ